MFLSERVPPDSVRLNSMRFSVVFVVCWLAICAQAQPNSRFDGIWSGIENAIGPPKMSSGDEKFIPQPQKITIIIAQGGTLLGIKGGNCPGRYDNVQRGGDTLSFGAGDCKLTVRLSKDGKTLTEEGSSMKVAQMAHTQYHGSYPSIVAPLQLRATLHRSSN
jgi:hypothetical protein